MSGIPPEGLRRIFKALSVKQFFPIIVGGQAVNIRLNAKALERSS